MSQAGRPRPRYIACTVTAGAPVSRRALQNALTGQARKAGIADDLLPKVTRYEQPDAVVWSDHRVAGEVRRVLQGMTWAIEGDKRVALEVETLDTSGTIRRLTRRTGALRRRGSDAKAAKGQPGRRSP